MCKNIHEKYILTHFGSIIEDNDKNLGEVSAVETSPIAENDDSQDGDDDNGQQCADNRLGGVVGQFFS